MKTVEKQGSVFHLVADAAEREANDARASHEQDCAILEAGGLELKSIAVILLHLAQRLLALEQHR